MKAVEVWDFNENGYEKAGDINGYDDKTQSGANY